MNKIPVVKFKSNLEKNGFEIKQLGQLLAIELPKDHNPFNPHRLDFFAVLVYTAGVGSHSIDFKNYDLIENDCLVISRGQVHAFKANTQYEGFIMMFTEDFLLRHLPKDIVSQFSRLYNYHIFHPKYQIPPDSLLLLELIEREQGSTEKRLKYHIISALLGAWLCKLEQFSTHREDFLKNTESSYILFDQFKNLVEKNYQKNRNANDYALNLNVSYKHLNTTTRILTNKTAKRFIDDFIILEAKRVLCSTTLSVKEISFKFGFDEPTNFQKYFKKLTGQTPAYFRKNN